MKCRICSNTSELIEEVDMPAQVSVLYDKPCVQKSNIVAVYKCSICGHVQIPDINKDYYYDDYLMSTATNIEAISEIRENQMKTLVSLSENFGSFIDIGCGPGGFLGMAGRHFKNVLGVEPSETAAKIAEKNGYNIINDYFSSKMEGKVKCNAFTAMQVFEHIANPLEVLSYAYEISFDRAVGLIEVPNGQKIFNQKLYHSVFSDHINYYTPMSLCKLADNAGFDVIFINESLNGDHLEMYLRKQSVTNSFSEKMQNKAKEILLITSGYKIISAWGAGAKAFGFIKLLKDTLPIKYIFDIDELKCGKYIPGASMPVILPEKSKINENELIIIFAASYEGEIIRNLKKKYNYKSDILCIGDEIKLISTNE